MLGIGLCGVNDNDRVQLPSVSDRLKTYKTDFWLRGCMVYIYIDENQGKTVRVSRHCALKKNTTHKLYDQRTSSVEKKDWIYLW